jgi:hypothetical protein
MLFDGFGFPLIQTCQFISSPSFDTEQLIQLCMNRLRVSMLSPLNEQCHKPCRNRRNRVPIKRIKAEEQPCDGIAKHYEERGRARYEDANTRKCHPDL